MGLRRLFPLLFLTFTACDLETPSATSFVLKNDTSAAILVWSDGWLSLVDSTGAIVQRSLDPCAGAQCGAQDRACPPVAPPIPTEIPAGGRQEISWTGRMFAQEPQRGCWVEKTAASGRYQATFCFGYKNTNGSIDQQICKNVSFTLGQAEVSYSVDKRPPEPLTVTLANARAAAIFIKANEACSSTPGWISFTDPNGQTISLEGPACGCSCGMVCPPCARAGAACIAPRIAPIEPGANTMTSWSGIYWSVTNANGQSCQEQTVAGPGQYTAHFCWGTGRTNDTDFADLTGPECSDVQFTVTDQHEVRFDVR